MAGENKSGKNGQYLDDDEDKSVVDDYVEYEKEQWRRKDDNVRRLKIKVDRYL